MVVPVQSEWSTDELLPTGNYLGNQSLLIRNRNDNGLCNFQTHHLACMGSGEEFKGLNCKIFTDPHPMTMALSVLVTIEMLNAMNR